MGRPELFRIDVDHQRGQQDEAADQDLEEAVDIHVVEPIVEHAEPDPGNAGIVFGFILVGLGVWFLLYQ